jgi:hypothetical protein
MSLANICDMWENFNEIGILFNQVFILNFDVGVYSIFLLIIFYSV